MIDVGGLFFDFDRSTQALSKIADKVKNFCVVYLVDITEVPDFNTMYELYDPCTVMTFFRNKHIMIDLVLTQCLFRTFPIFKLRRRRLHETTSRRWRLHDHMRVDASREKFCDGVVPRRARATTTRSTGP